MAGVNPATGRFDPYYDSGPAATSNVKVTTDKNGVQTFTNIRSTPQPSTPQPTGGSGTQVQPQTAASPSYAAQPVTVPPKPFSALQELEDALYATIGVHGLGGWAADLYNRGATVDQIVRALRYGTDTSEAGKAAYAAYLNAFPDMDKFLKEGIFYGSNPELQYLQYRDIVKDAAARYGVDPGLMTNRRIADYIGSGTSAAELQDRMALGAAALATTPPEVFAVMNAYGYASGNDLMSFYLDTDETEAMLKKRYLAAQIGAESTRQRFGVDKAYAEGLAERGITADQANSGFAKAFARLGFTFGHGETIGRTDLADAVFGDAGDAQKMERIGQSRIARFSGGGDFTGDRTGVKALGAATV